MVGKANNDGDREGAERAPRTSRLISTQLYASRVGERKVVIRNLSVGGLGGKCDEPLLPGERVTVAIINIGMVEGTVAWADGKSFGMRFDTAIDPARVTLPQSGPAPDGYVVPDRFRPETSTRRPGFGHRSGR